MSSDEEDIDSIDESVEEVAPKPKRRRKKKKKKDPNRPKRNMSAFFLYSNANRARIKEENPEAKFGDIVSTILVDDIVSCLCVGGAWFVVAVALPALNASFDMARPLHMNAMLVYGSPWGGRSMRPYPSLRGLSSLDYPSLRGRPKQLSPPQGRGHRLLIDVHDVSCDCPRRPNGLLDPQAATRTSSPLPPPRAGGNTIMVGAEVEAC